MWWEHRGNSPGGLVPPGLPVTHWARDTPVLHLLLLGDIPLLGMDHDFHMKKREEGMAEMPGVLLPYNTTIQC